MIEFPRFPQGTTADAVAYLDLVRGFSAGELGPTDFGLSFRRMWGAQEILLPEALFEQLQEVFWATEDFVEDDRLRDPGELDADQFRARVAELEPELIARFEEARRREGAGS